MLVRQRARNAERSRSPLERAAFSAYAWLFSSPRLFPVLSRLGRWAQRLLLGQAPERSFLARRVPALFGWLRYRALPQPPERAFRDRFAELERENRPD